MHQGRRANYLSAKHFANRLMAETHTKYGCGLMEASNHVFRDARIRRYTRPRRNHDPRRCQPLDFVEADLIIAIHAQFFTQLAEVLDEVVRERIVVIDDENHSPLSSSNPFCASVISRIRALDLFTVSMYSFSGIESATIPPPAWTYPLLPRTTRVRIAMHASRL